MTPAGCVYYTLNSESVPENGPYIIAVEILAAGRYATHGIHVCTMLKNVAIKQTNVN